MTRRTQSTALALVCAMFTAAVVNVTTAPAHASTTWDVSRTSDDVGDPTADCPGPDCTLRGAVTLADDGDVIELAAGTFELDEQITITTGLTISGQGRGNTTVRPSSGDHRSFEINAPGKNIVIESLTIRDGGGTASDHSGGAINVVEANLLTIRSAGFIDNVVPTGGHQSGGAINFAPPTGSLDVSASHFQGNASARGGAIHVTGTSGSVSIVSSEFRSNSVSGTGPNYGGAVDIAGSNGDVVISNAQFMANHASLLAGAINLEASTASITRSTFVDNQSQFGGAIGLLDGSSISVLNSTFNANTGASDGSLIASPSGSNEATVRFSTIVDHADAVYVAGALTLAINDSALQNVDGCAPADTTGSLRDASSDSSCGIEAGGGLGLINDLIEPYFVPSHDSPLLLASSGACPDDDQRGVSRPSDPCAVGSIDQSGLSCPAGPLDRDVPITCQLDVALHGPDQSVEVVHGADSDQFDTPVSGGQGELAFVLSLDEPATTVDVAVGGGAYSTTLPVVPIGGGGGTGGGGSGGNSGGGGGGAGTNGGGSDTSPSPADDDLVDAVGGATKPEDGADRPMLAATGATHTSMIIAALLAIGAGITVLRTGPRAIERARGGH